MSRLTDPRACADPSSQPRQLRAGGLELRGRGSLLVKERSRGAFGGLQLGTKRPHVPQNGRKLLGRGAEARRRSLDVCLWPGSNGVAITDRWRRRRSPG